MGRAEDLFHQIVERGEEAIDEFFVTRQSEELFLDFKRSGDNGTGRALHQSDLDNLAKCISGFGNSEGGIIVWGVDCNDKDNTGDFPKARVPIQNPARFVSRLEGAVSGRTIPPHPGVRHIAILSDANPDEGFVVTYIPKSPLMPHQTVPSLDFYVRTGSNFVKAPYGVLAGLFGRPPQPELFHTWAYTPPRIVLKGAKRVDINLTLTLHNRGPGIARDLYVNLLMFPSPATQIAMQAKEEVWKGHMTYGVNTSLIADQSVRLAPGGIVPVLKLICQFSPPFTQGFSHQLSYGDQASPRKVVRVDIEPDVVMAAYEQLTETKVSPEKAKAFVCAVFGLSDPETEQTD